jgi:hypothetical protein
VRAAGADAAACGRPGLTRSCKTPPVGSGQAGASSHYPTVTPHLAIGDVAAALEFYPNLPVRLGFAHQSHVVNQFTALVGVPPGEYRRRPALE